MAKTYEMKLNTTVTITGNEGETIANRNAEATWDEVTGLSGVTDPTEFYYRTQWLEASNGYSYAYPPTVLFNTGSFSNIIGAISADEGVLAIGESADGNAPTEAIIIPQGIIYIWNEELEAHSAKQYVYTDASGSQNVTVFGINARTYE